MKLTSRDNPRVRHWMKLASDGRYRRSKGRALIEGPHLVQAAREAGVRIHAVLVSEKARQEGSVVLSERIFAGVVDAESPQGIAAEISIPAGKVADGDTVFLEGVQDPGNVGAIIRSAAAFGVRNVVLDARQSGKIKAIVQGIGTQIVFALLVLARFLPDQPLIATAVTTSKAADRRASSRSATSTSTPLRRAQRPAVASRSTPITVVAGTSARRCAAIAPAPVHRSTARPPGRGRSADARRASSSVWGRGT